jgi:hypothetical protein
MLADVLDIGSSRWDDHFSKAGDLNFSAPSEFTLPNVANVSLILIAITVPLFIFRFILILTFNLCMIFPYYVFVKQPAEFCSANFTAEKGKDYDQDIKFMKGTTTLAFKVPYNQLSFCFFYSF